MQTAGYQSQSQHDTAEGARSLRGDRPRAISGVTDQHVSRRDTPSGSCRPQRVYRAATPSIGLSKVTGLGGDSHRLNEAGRCRPAVAWARNVIFAVLKPESLKTLAIQDKLTL